MKSKMMGILFFVFLICSVITDWALANEIGNLSPLKVNHNIVQYGAVQCERALLKEVRLEAQLVKMALNSPSPQAQLFQLLQDYGIISSAHFKMGLVKFLANYGLNGEQIDLVLAPKPKLISHPEPMYPPKKAEIKAQLEIFWSIAPLGKPGALSNMISQRTVGSTLQIQNKTLPQSTFLSRFHDFSIDLPESFVSELKSSHERIGSGKIREEELDRAQINIETLNAHLQLLIAMEDMSLRVGGRNGEADSAPLLLALAPLFEHLLAKSAEIIALQIESSLERSTSIFYNRLLTYPLAGGLGLLASYLGVDALTLFGFHSQGLAHGLLVGMPAFGIGHLAAYIHNPVTFAMARGQVGKDLERSPLQKELKFGPYTFAVEKLLYEVDSGKTPIGVKIEELCPNQELCRLTPAQISVIGDLEIDFLWKRVEALGESEEVASRINSRIGEILKLGSEFIEDFQRSRPHISGEQFQKLDSLRLELATLAGSPGNFEGQQEDLDVILNPKFQLELLRGSLALKQQALQKAMTAIAVSVGETERDRQLRLFLLSKLADHEKQLSSMTSKLHEIENGNGWLDWRASVPKEAATLMSLILNQVLPKYSHAESREGGFRIFQDGLHQFRERLPLRNLKSAEVISN